MIFSGSICLIDAVSALRNPVASKDLAESHLGLVSFDRGNCEAKNPGREHQVPVLSLKRGTTSRLGTYTCWRLDGTCPARWNGTLG